MDVVFLPHRSSRPTEPSSGTDSGTFLPHLGIVCVSSFFLPTGCPSPRPVPSRTLHSPSTTDRKCTWTPPSLVYRRDPSLLQVGLGTDTFCSQISTVNFSHNRDFSLLLVFPFERSDSEPWAVLFSSTPVPPRSSPPVTPFSTPFQSIITQDLSFEPVPFSLLVWSSQDSPHHPLSSLHRFVVLF